MGKSIPSAQKLHQFARFINSPDNGPRRPAQLTPLSKTRQVPSPEPIRPRHDSYRLRLNTRQMETAESADGRRRMPLADVVADCVRRWFQDTLKEAKNGDTSMQVLVGQMYYSGYGVARDVQKGKAWLSRATNSQPSACKVDDKHPGYNSSDSDSDDAKELKK